MCNEHTKAFLKKKKTITHAITAYVLGRLAWEIPKRWLQQDDVMPSPFQLHQLRGQCPWVADLSAPLCLDAVLVGDAVTTLWPRSG